MSNLFDNKSGLQTGLIWGGIMFVIMTFVFPLFDGDPITVKSLWIGLITWPLAGIGFGYTMKKVNNREADNKENGRSKYL